MAKTIRVEKRFKELAQLLVEMMVESESTMSIVLEYAGVVDKTYMEFDPKVSAEAKRKTAIALQKGFKCGDFNEDDEGRLYYVGMVEEFGGWIEKDLVRQAKKLKGVHMKTIPTNDEWGKHWENLKKKRRAIAKDKNLSLKTAERLKDPDYEAAYKEELEWRKLGFKLNYLGI